MRLKISAGYSAPLLISSFAAILAGCPTGTAQKDSSTPPSVTAVYAVDASNASLADVALYLRDDPFSKSGGPRVSAKAPASYSAFRVEVDQPLKGDSVGPLETLNNNGTADTPDYSACTQSSTVQFIDVDGGGGVAAGTQIPSSVCYNPSTTIGSNPHIDITPGAGPAATDVFTCQAFNAAGGLSPSHTYAIAFKSGVKGSNGQDLKFPTGGTSGGGTWANSTFTFQTSDLELLQAAYIDASTGYYHVIAKPSRGYLKDLDPEDDKTYRQPPTSDPFLVFLSDVVKADKKTGVIATGDKNDAVTVTRKQDGSVFAVSVDNASFGDPRVLSILPAGTWEPNVTYVVTVNPTIISADSANPIGGTATTYTFTAADAPLKVLQSNPDLSVTGVSQTLAATGGAVVLLFQSPVDPATVTAANITLKTAAGDAVDADIIPPDASSNFQLVAIAPKARLLPSTSYTVTANNLKTNPTDPKEQVSKNFLAYTNTFTTISFQLSRVSDLGSSATANIDRSLTVSPLAVANGNLVAVFNNTPTASTVSASSLHLSELDAANNATDVGATVTQKSPSTFSLKAPTGYVVKFGQRYQVKADTSITDPNGVKLKQEGCVATDCPDTRVFATRLLGVSLSATDTAAGKFKISYNFPVDASTLTPLLPLNASDTGKAVQLFKQATDGTLTPVPITCTTPDTSKPVTSTVCSSVAALDPNAAYVLNFIASTTAPLKVAPTLTDKTGTYTTDQASGSFAGIVRTTFTSDCAPTGP